MTPSSKIFRGLFETFLSVRPAPGQAEVFVHASGGKHGAAVRALGDEGSSPCLALSEVVISETVRDFSATSVLAMDERTDYVRIIHCLKYC